MRRPPCSGRAEPEAGAPNLGRRAFLLGGAAFVASASLVSPFEALADRARRPSPGYGPLRPVDDRVTGLPLLQLPEGFRYVSMSWTGDPMANGELTPARHDGGAALHGPGRTVHYVRNHEVSLGSSLANRVPFAPVSFIYDPGGAMGGTTTVVFDPRGERYVRTVPSLGGTVRNCAGGPTPWNSWLSCEETLQGPGDGKLEQTHGWVFEVPARVGTRPVPLRGLGRFVHEAVAVSPSGWVYETEDERRSGLYRFAPERRGDLAGDGTLEMLALQGLTRFNTSVGLQNGDSFGVRWVTIDDPEHTPFLQGLERGGAVFERGEGMWWSHGKLYFTATTAGAAGQGQVWELDPGRDRLKLLFESPGRSVLEKPDNVAVSPRGGIVLCEDGDRKGLFLRGLTREGGIFDFARNNVVLDESRNEFVRAGDYRDEEFAGASFSPDGRWLFVSIQTPGITFAITGAWERGAL